MQNVANLFNLTGVTNREATKTELWDTWIVGAPVFGVNTPSKVYAAIAADKNLDGVFNDAPSVVPDAEGNGICDERDLQALGVALNIRQTSFFINPWREECLVRAVGKQATPFNVKRQPVRGSSSAGNQECVICAHNARQVQR